MFRNLLHLSKQGISFRLRIGIRAPLIKISIFRLLHNVNANPNLMVKKFCIDRTASPISGCVGEFLECTS